MKPGKMMEVQENLDLKKREMEILHGSKFSEIIHLLNMPSNMPKNMVLKDVNYFIMIIMNILKERQMQ
jgi:Ni,Fe-hydrogenase maturation factor